MGFAMAGQDLRKASSEFAAMVSQNPGVRDVVARWVAAVIDDAETQAHAYAVKGLFDDSVRAYACSLCGKVDAYREIEAILTSTSK